MARISAGTRLTAGTRLKPSIWQYFGINIGNDTNFGDGTTLASQTSTFDSDCEFLYNMGVRYFRVSGCDPSDQAIALTKERYIVTKLLSLGAHVQYIVFGSSDEMRAEAIWAQSQGVERLQIENEWELHGGGLTVAQIYTEANTRCDLIRTDGFTGEITYSVAQDNYSQWTANGIGSFDDIGGDIYGDGNINAASLSSFISKVASFKTTFGSAAYIAEYAVSQNGTNINIYDPFDYSKWMMDRLVYLKSNFTKPCYLHCWRFNGTNSLDLWASVKDSGLFRNFFYRLLECRTPIYY